MQRIKVKFRVSIAGPSFSFMKNAIADVPTPQATVWIEQGICEEIVVPAEETRVVVPRETAAPRGAKNRR